MIQTKYSEPIVKNVFFDDKEKCRLLANSREPITAFIIICNAAGPLKEDRTGII